jgi:nucleotide-binding universal stress UspA family protein
MLTTVVVPLDGSVLGDRALPFATRLVRATNGGLILVRAGLARKAWVLDEEVLTLLVETRRAAVELAAVADHLQAEGIAVETCVRYDDAAGAITDVARDRQADLIVMSMLGASGVGRSVYGSVVEGVLRQTEVPVLLVPTVCETTWPTSRVLRVLVPLDGSTVAEAALGPALALAETVGGELLLVHALPEAPTEAEASTAADYLDGLSGAIGCSAPTIPLRVHVLPHTPLVAIVREQGADVIALTTQGRGRTQRLTGATASDTLRRACVPVVLVRPVGAGETTPRGPTDSSASLTGARAMGKTETAIARATGGRKLSPVSMAE